MALIAAGRRENEPLRVSHPALGRTLRWWCGPLRFPTIHVDPPALDNEAKRRRQGHRLAIERVPEPLGVRRSGATRTESWEVIANEEEAAIGLSGRISLNGLPPSPGPVKRIVEGSDRRGVARVAGITLRDAGFAGTHSSERPLWAECAGCDSGGGGAFRALSSVERSRTEPVSVLSESGSDGVVVAEDGPIGATLGS